MNLWQNNYVSLYKERDFGWNLQISPFGLYGKEKLKYLEIGRTREATNEPKTWYVTFLWAGEMLSIEVGRH